MTGGGGQARQVTLPLAADDKTVTTDTSGRVYQEPDGGTVQVAYVHPHTVSHSWHQSLMSLVAYDASHSARVLRTAGPMMMRADTGGLVEARNDIVTAFLDDTTYDWLWMVDTDMGFAPDTVDRLVAAAHQVGSGAVGAMCFGWREIEHDGMGGRRCVPVPTTFKLAAEPDGTMGFAVEWDYPRGELVQVAGTGAACLLLHREVLWRIRGRFGDKWFDRVKYSNGTVISEDLSFCYRLGTVGEPMWVDTGIQTTHHKQLWVGEDEYERVRNSMIGIAAESASRATAERQRRVDTLGQFGGGSDA